MGFFRGGDDDEPTPPQPQPPVPSGACPAGGEHAYKRQGDLMVCGNAGCNASYVVG